MTNDESSRNDAVGGTSDKSSGSGDDGVDVDVTHVRPMVRIPDDIAASAEQTPIQPRNISPPVTYFSGKKRSFNPSWFASYKWLEYSVKANACFCYPCRIFGGGSNSRAVDVFTVTGFKNWKHATGKRGSLLLHDTCSSHRQAIVAWDMYNATTVSGTVSDQLGNARAEQVASNRHYIKTIAEVILLCARQDISLRGHREAMDSTNRGNFLEMLSLVAKHDDSVQQHIKNNPRNATYTSPDIQNALLNVMGTIVRNEITSSVRDATYFSIMADETKDLSKQEQLAIVVRYVDIRSCTIYERFVTYLHAKSLDASSLSSYILSVIEENRLDIKGGLVSQCYDGASVMSGKYTGVQQRIRDVAPQATYIHCHAHILNLVLVDCAKNVSEADEFFQLLQALYVFISSSKAHVIYTSKQCELHSDKPVHQMKRLSDTRWSCRYAAVDTVCCTYDSILACLESIVDGDDRSKAIEANGILLQIRTHKFLFLLVVFWRLLSCTKMLSDSLQGKDMDMSKAAELVSATIETLLEFRNDDCRLNQILKYTNEVAALHDIDIASSIRPRRKQVPPRHLEDQVVFETTGVREGNDSSSNRLRTSIYLPILDCMLNEMRRRFSTKNLDLMKAIQSCSPASVNFLDHQQLIPIANAYNLNMVSLSAECPMAKRTLSGKDIGSVHDVFVELSPFQTAFPNLVKALQIILTIAVSSASCERSFSSLKRIKTWLRTTMKEERLVDLATLSIERDLSAKISLEQVVRDFAGKDKNRRIILS